jgi:hypothetical protein
MDGTIADLYGTEGWLNALRNYDATPYTVAQPLVNMKEVVKKLHLLKKLGWDIEVITWGAKGSTNDFDCATAKAKKEWLDRFEFPYDEFLFCPYGTPKHKMLKAGGMHILIDDDRNVRKAWDKGRTVNPKEVNIEIFLTELLNKF